MADRTFKKPDSFQVKVRMPDGTETTAPYGFDDFLVEYVWPHAKWNEDAWEEAQIRIGDALEGVEDGGDVGLKLEDWEKLREAVKAAQIGGRYAPKVRRMTRAVNTAC
jgi:hypothetical protein